ncbi:MAG TPA: LytR C-terminal domain-containing protein, partial [Acidimicrobiales bacterium]|nr:LytR C-terminal domain-containing protein [Acidimicrobiales bacterium]
SSALQGEGFTVSGTGDASTYNYAHTEIEYGSGTSGALAAATELRAGLVSGATLVPDASLSGSNVTLIVGSDYNGVRTPPAASGSGVTTTTVTSNTQPPPSDIVFDNPKTLPEPWNPTTCTP